MKKFFVEVLVDEERLLEQSEMNNFHDAMNGEFGWLEESGIQMTDWIRVSMDKNIREFRGVK